MIIWYDWKGWIRILKKNKKFQRHWEYCFVFMETILTTTFMQFYILICFVHKQKCSPWKSRIKENVVMAVWPGSPDMGNQTVIESRATHPSLIPLLFLTAPPPSWAFWVSRIVSGKYQVEEEMFFAFLKCWNSCRVLMLMNKSKVRMILQHLNMQHKYVASLTLPIYKLYVHGQIIFM